MEDGEQRNYYELLGVERSASTEEIKNAYREIARVLHPDSNFYSEIIDYKLSNNQIDLFKEVTSAYHTLINKEKREAYDRTLPPELTGWEQDEDEDELVNQKLEELGLKEPSAKKADKKKVKSAAFGVFGSADNIQDDAEETASIQSPRRASRPQPTSAGAGGIGLSMHRMAAYKPDEESKSDARSLTLTPKMLYIGVGVGAFLIGAVIFAILLATN